MSGATAPKKLVDLGDEELAELLALVGGSDSVELKLTIPDADQRSTITALGLDPLEAQIRQVFFFDTPDLALNEAGVVARARRVQGRHARLGREAAPGGPGPAPGDAAQLAGVQRRGRRDAGRLRLLGHDEGRRSSRTDIADAVAGERPLRELFNKGQREFFAEHAPDGIELDDLSVMGPIFVLKLKTDPEGFPTEKLVSEAWLYPDGERILELSTKCPPAEMFDAAVRARAYLAGLGVDLSGEQQTKTKTALEFFSKQLR